MNQELRKVHILMSKLSPEFRLNEATPTFDNTFNAVENATTTVQKKIGDSIGGVIDKTNNVNYSDNGNYRLETYGDLKKAVNVIRQKQTGSKLAGEGINTIIGAIPFVGNAKTVYDFIKAAVSKPDNKKTNTWIDKLDIDDDMSKIIDDTVENGFIEYIVNKIKSTPDETPLKQDFNMNDELSEYLKQNYSNRTVIGYD